MCRAALLKPTVPAHICPASCDARRDKQYVYCGAMRRIKANVLQCSIESTVQPQKNSNSSRATASLSCLRNELTLSGIIKWIAHQPTCQLRLICVQIPQTATQVAILSLLSCVSSKLDTAGIPPTSTQPPAGDQHIHRTCFCSTQN